MEPIAFITHFQERTNTKVMVVAARHNGAVVCFQATALDKPVGPIQELMSKEITEAYLSQHGHESLVELASGALKLWIEEQDRQS